VAKHAAPLGPAGSIPPLHALADGAIPEPAGLPHYGGRQSAQDHRQYIGTHCVVLAHEPQGGQVAGCGLRAGVPWACPGRWRSQQLSHGHHGRHAQRFRRTSKRALDMRRATACRPAGRAARLGALRRSRLAWRREETGPPDSLSRSTPLLQPGQPRSLGVPAVQPAAYDRPASGPTPISRCLTPAGSGVAAPLLQPPGSLATSPHPSFLAGWH
jgi:hypothetical protein